MQRVSRATRRCNRSSKPLEPANECLLLCQRPSDTSLNWHPRSLRGNNIQDQGMHAIGNALLGGAASSLCALNCDAFNVPLGAANLDLSNKRLGAAAATLLAGVIKGNTTIISLKCVQSRISHMVDQCLCLIQALSLAVLASNSVSARFCKPPPWSVRFCVSAP